MPIFGRRPPPLPTTTYGYTPPEGATASGWQCNNDGCGTSDQPAPRSWPFSCTLCGRIADPDFDLPWSEDARGPRLRHLIDQEEQASPGHHLFIGELWAWEYAAALRAGDVTRAEEMRTGCLTFLASAKNQNSYFNEGSAHFQIVMAALQHGQTDAAAHQLRVWNGTVSTHDVRDNNTSRTNARQLLSSQLSFLENPTARRHQSAPEVAAAARNLAAAIRDVLSIDLEQRLRRL